ncbi:MAG: methyltransferase domain-containing protein [Bdellovibrionota bacterium]
MLEHPSLLGPLIGNDVANIFFHLKNFSSVKSLFWDTTLQSYEVHFGKEGKSFIERIIMEIPSLLTKQDPDNLQSYLNVCRDVGAQIRSLRTKRRDKTSSLSRTIKLVGDQYFNGHVVDLGADLNQLGQKLVEGNSSVTKVTGVDLEHRDGVFQNSAVRFYLQSNAHSIPIETCYADTVVSRYAFHHMSFKEQVELTKEGFRILRNKGIFILIEDSFSVSDLPLCTNDLTHRFQTLDTVEKIWFLSFMDASSCFLFSEVMPFNFTFRSIEDWEKIFNQAGFSTVSKKYWGMTYFSLFLAPTGILVFKKN